MSSPGARLELVVDDLTVERGGRTVISGLSFVVKAGEVLVLTGHNGAGKTTLLRTLAGFIAPVRGSLSLTGSDADRALGEQLHYVGHANGIRSSLTVAENARFWASFLGGSSTETDAALERFGIDTCPPAKSGASGSPACCSPSALSGCSTSRRPHSMPPRPRSSLA